MEDMGIEIPATPKEEIEEETEEEDDYSNKYSEVSHRREVWLNTIE